MEPQATHLRSSLPTCSPGTPRSSSPAAAGACSRRRGADRARCTWLCGDIREVADRGRIVATALERHSRADTLLDNAGGQYFAAAEVITP